MYCVSLIMFPWGFPTRARQSITQSAVQCNKLHGKANHYLFFLPEQIRHPKFWHNLEFELGFLKLIYITISAVKVQLKESASKIYKGYFEILSEIPDFELQK